MTATCTGFLPDEITVLIKLQKNILHVCNECTDKKTKKPESDKMNDKINDLDVKVSSFQNDLRESLQAITEIKNEMKKAFNTKANSYANALGNVNPGKQIQKETTAHNGTPTGILIRGVPEEENSNADERMKNDKTAVRSILDFLEIPAEITKCSRLGKFENKPKTDLPENEAPSNETKDQKRKTPRTILIDLRNGIDKELLLKSAYRLKDFKDYVNPVFVSRELNREELKKQNDALKQRRALLNKDADPKTLRIRNLSLEIKENGEWKPVPSES